MFNFLEIILQTETGIVEVQLRRIKKPGPLNFKLIDSMKFVSRCFSYLHISFRLVSRLEVLSNKITISKEAEVWR